MRTELSDFNTGESVCMVAEFINYGRFLFDGENKLIDQNPITGLCVAMQFYHKDELPTPIRDISQTTLVKPISFNDLPTNISHMWIAEKLAAIDGSELSPKMQFRVYGHIEPYQKENGTKDFCFNPYSGITLL